ncbi:hypothetical protein PT276_09115 [Orbaceae bacterium ESL0721]|nr:hypothetical protein [Orbaceae bacterium ESL0721]
MSYLSIEFSLLFIVFFAIYWCIKPYPKLQNIFLLLASYCIVVSYNWQFALILFGYTLVIYLLSQLIFNAKRYSKLWLIVALCAAIANLALFKYFDFFRYELQSLLNILHISMLLPVISLVLPIGISFYTFHSVSYLVSINRRELQPVKFWDFALFLSFFPSIIAGPINRAKTFLPQITVLQPREILEPYRAFTLIILAVIKVYCLGGLLDENWVTSLYSNPMEYGSLDLLFGLYSYALLIYVNFSGYTDLVTGMALLLGFRLPINFNLPYLAVNLRDFWARWHISLCLWIRDYLYIPLGGNRHGFIRTQINIMIAMLLSGLWHGAGINFIIWGGFHGIGLIGLNLANRFLGKDLIAKRSILLARVITIHYVCFAWLFFHCASFTDAIDYLVAIINNVTVANRYQFETLAIALLYFCYPWLKNLPNNFTKKMSQINYLYVPLIYILVLWITIYFAPTGVPNFIYANF